MALVGCGGGRAHRLECLEPDHAEWGRRHPESRRANRFDAVGASTPQFVVGDTWLFVVALKYGFPKGFDGTRDTEWRSGNFPAGSTIEWRRAISAQRCSPRRLRRWIAMPRVTATFSLKAQGWGVHRSADDDDPGDVDTRARGSSLPSSPLAPLPTGGSVRRMGRRAAAICAGVKSFWVSSLVFDRTFDIGFQRHRRRLRAINEDVLARGPGPMMLDGDYLRLTYAAMSTADRARMSIALGVAARPGESAATVLLCRPVGF